MACWTLALLACAYQPEVRTVSPRAHADPATLLGGTKVQMVRLVLVDSSVVALFHPHLEPQAVAGIRDAGPPRRVPLDSIARVSAFVPAPKNATGEWIRLGLILAGVASVAACVVGWCSSGDDRD